LIFSSTFSGTFSSYLTSLTSYFFSSTFSTFFSYFFSTFFSVSATTASVDIISSYYRTASLSCLCVLTSFLASGLASFLRGIDFLLADLVLIRVFDTGGFTVTYATFLALGLEGVAACFFLSASFFFCSKTFFVASSAAFFFF
jgi:hypothetical protein